MANSGPNTNKSQLQVIHAGRGIISIANLGPNTNKSHL